MSSVRIEYMRVGGELYAVDRVGDVAILVDARTALNERAYNLLTKHARADETVSRTGGCSVNVRCDIAIKY